MTLSYRARAIASALAAGAFFTGHAFAGDTAPPPMLASAAAPEAAGPVDPERLALARQLFSIMHLDKLLTDMIGGALGQMRLPSSSEADRAKAQRLIGSIRAGFDAVIPDLIDSMEQLYARTLTATEMRDTIAFYNSPSGQSAMAKVPVLMRQAMPLSINLMPKIYDVAEKDYCARQPCTDDDHALFRRIRDAADAANPRQTGDTPPGPIVGAAVR